MQQAEATDPIAAGRDAATRGAWDEAYELLAAADRSHALASDALVTLAEAAYATSHPDHAIAIWERLYASALDAGDKPTAANAALWVTILLVDTTKLAPLRGWQRRLDALLAQLEESPIHAGADVVRAFYALMIGDLDVALEAAERGLAAARRLDHRPFTAVAMNAKARVLILRGSLREGLELLEESAVSALSGELGQLGTGIVYCSTICACQSIGEYERAEEWTAAMERWTHSAIHPRGFHGRCRVHRAQIESRRGQWSAALQDARTGADELRAYAPLEEGWGLSELGAIRLRMGDLDGAERDFEAAYAAGWDPQPGAALLRLARGDVAGAARSIGESLDSPSQTPSREVPPNTDLRRAPLLEAQVEIEAAHGDIERARWAADELAAIAARLDLRTLGASAAVANGRVLLAAGDAQAARQSFATGVRLWQELGAPYEAARARLALARTLLELGSRERAATELRAARQEFERLGARLDAHVAATVAAGASRGGIEWPGQVAASTERRQVVFMFTDIVRSTDLARVMGDDAWQHLLRWHNDAIQSLAEAHLGSVASNTGDGYMLTFETASDAVSCAIAIQQALDEHRRQHGFAPDVRIGIHRAQATREGGLWSGAGVHLAARIGALGDRGEIIASRETAEAAGAGHRRSLPESVSVKGFDDPVEIVRIGWAAA